MKKINGVAKAILGLWLAAWPAYLCATWAAVGSATAAFATLPQAVALIVVLASAVAIWARTSILNRVGSSVVVVSGLAAYALFLVNLQSSPIAQASGSAGASGVSPATRVIEVVTWFLFIAGYFTLLFGLIRQSRARRTWLVFAAMYSALIWAWTNFTGTKLLNGSVQRLFDLAILEALFTLSTLLIGLILMIDLIWNRVSARRSARS